MTLKPVDYAKNCCSYQRNKIWFLQTCTATILVCFVCYTYIQEGQKTPQEQKERKRILLWTTFFNEQNWLPSTSDLNCPIHCDVTSNRSLFAKSSAVIMHWRNIEQNDLPDCVQENQTVSNPCPVLILFNKEAPPHTPGNQISKLNNKIHWTATYRRDSDVYTPYGKIINRTDKYILPKLETNRSLVCWLVSNCNTPSSRETYVHDLQRHLDVEVYGTCGEKTCPYKKSSDCYRWLSERCKFYLSFENSICKDYATEKLYYAMMTDMVPVVLGGDDYSRYLPAHSFVDVADYPTPKALAAHLKELDKDDASYLSYFNWKKRYVAIPVEYEWLCDLCERLYWTGSNTLKPYDNVMAWWFDSANCGSLSESVSSPS